MFNDILVLNQSYPRVCSETLRIFSRDREEYRIPKTLPFGTALILSDLEGIRRCSSSQSLN
jgi:hypothetical protein